MLSEGIPLRWGVLFLWAYVGECVKFAYICGMKTFLFDTLNRFRRFSENLDVKATLCNKVWLVFNDSGEKEVYIFQEDGTLLITYSGRVTHGTWKYIAANKSIIISAGSQSYMVHPEFTDRVLFVLKVDGTNECAFLIDENNAQCFAPKSYKALMTYFETKERKILEEEQRKRQQAIEAENRRRLVAIEEQRQRELDEEQRKKQEKEEQRKRRQEEKQAERRQKEREEHKQKEQHVESIFNDKIEFRGKDFLWFCLALICVVFLTFMPLVYAEVFADNNPIVHEKIYDETSGEIYPIEEYETYNDNFILLISGLISTVGFGLLCLVPPGIKKRRMMKYIRTHIDDWETPLLVEKYNSSMPKRLKIDLEVLKILEKYKM